MAWQADASDRGRGAVGVEMAPQTSGCVLAWRARVAHTNEDLGAQGRCGWRGRAPTEGGGAVGVGMARKDAVGGGGELRQREGAQLVLAWRARTLWVEGASSDRGRGAVGVEMAPQTSGCVLAWRARTLWVEGASSDRGRGRSWCGNGPPNQRMRVGMARRAGSPTEGGGAVGVEMAPQTSGCVLAWRAEQDLQQREGAQLVLAWRARTLWVEGASAMLEGGALTGSCHFCRGFSKKSQKKSNAFTEELNPSFDLLNPSIDLFPSIDLLNPSIDLFPSIDFLKNVF
jgi:hypothetical protein